MWYAATAESHLNRRKISVKKYKSRGRFLPITPGFLPYLYRGGFKLGGFWGRLVDSYAAEGNTGLPRRQW